MAFCLSESSFLFAAFSLRLRALARALAVRSRRRAARRDRIRRPFFMSFSLRARRALRRASRALRACLRRALRCFLERADQLSMASMTLDTDLLWRRIQRMAFFLARARIFLSVGILSCFHRRSTIF